MVFFRKDNFEAVEVESQNELDNPADYYTAEEFFEIRKEHIKELYEKHEKYSRLSTSGDSMATKRANENLHAAHHEELHLEMIAKDYGLEHLLEDLLDELHPERGQDDELS